MKNVPQVLVLCALVFMAGCFSETAQQPEATPIEINGYSTEGANAAQLEAIKADRVGDFMPQDVPAEVERVMVKMTAAIKMGKPATSFLTAEDLNGELQIEVSKHTVIWHERGTGVFESATFARGDDDQPAMIEGDDDAPSYQWLRNRGHDTLDGEDVPFDFGASQKAARDVPPSIGVPICVGVPLCKGDGSYSKCVDACGDTFYMVRVDLTEWVCVSGGGGCVHSCTGFAGPNWC